MIKSKINNWAEEDRPREKLSRLGRRALSNAELLAILIRSGTRGESAVDLARRILLDVGNDLNNLSKLDELELSKYNGIGEAKALSIIAALELGRRRKEGPQQTRPVLRTSRDVFNHFREQLQDIPHEEFWVIYLNRGSFILDTQMIGKGGLDFTPVDIKAILRYALMVKAVSIILIHNHPSGSLWASEADKLVTDKIVRAAETLDLHVADHVIFTEDSYFSFRDRGLLG